MSYWGERKISLGNYIEDSFFLRYCWRCFWRDGAILKLKKNL